MTTPAAPGFAPKRYMVRFTAQAIEEIAAEAERLTLLVGEEIARQWSAGVYAAAGTLADNPQRYPLLAIESRYIGIPMRRLLYQRTGASAKYLLFYTLEEETQDTSQTGGLDGPRVILLHVRHGARRPLTRNEGRTTGERFARGI
jgi:hypothetical protein